MSVLVSFLAVLALPGSVRGQEQPAAEGAPPAAAPAVAAPAEAEESAAAPVVPSARRYREREADGTQAVNRFDEKNLVQKSQYKFNGEQLEVDPD